MGKLTEAPSRSRFWVDPRFKSPYPQWVWERPLKGKRFYRPWRADSIWVHPLFWSHLVH